MSAPDIMNSVLVTVVCVCLCLQTVVCQFGLFPQREQRRYPSPFGFSQNFFPNPSRISTTISKLLQLEHENPYSNPAYIYPFQNNPITNPNHNPYNVRFPNQGQQNNFGNPEYNNEPVTNPPNFQNNQNVNGDLTSGQQVGPVFGPTNEGSGGLVSGQQMGPVFGQDNGDKSGGTLVSGHQVSPVFTTEAPNNENPGNLISGQQNGPAFSTEPPSNGNSGGLISGQQNGPAFSTEAPSFTNSGNLVTGQQNSNPFSTEAPDQSNTGLVSGVQNGPVFGADENKKGNGGTLISGTHSGPVYSPDANVPAFESRNNFNGGIFKETCNTVGGGLGSCIAIVSCPVYVKLLQQARTSPSAVQELRAAQCGFEGNYPKVCCPLRPPPTPQTPPTPPTPSTPPTPPTPTPSGKSIPSDSDFITAFPEPPVCGVSNASFSRVVGGVDAKLGDFPWMALLGYKGRSGAGTRWLCGGSLVSHHHVLTAAHCIHNHEHDLYVVRLGELDLERDDEGATPIDVLIKQKIKHEKYNATSYTNDIGLLILQNDVDFTNLIRPICIPTRPDLRANLFVDYNPLIAGWGDTEFRGPSASHLQVLQLPVLDNSFCQKAYSRYKAQVIDERVMCAGYKKGGKDACQGDSGGPLMQPDYNPSTLTTYFYQTGVVSFGRKCAEAGYPGIYTRVTHFVPWLQKTMLGIDG